jgi:hypothetical protein
MSDQKKNDWTPLAPDIAAWIGIPFWAMVFLAVAFLPWRALAVAFLIAIGLGIIGIVLLFLARLPLYRQKRFFVFGPKHLDAAHRKLYQAAYAFVWISVFLLLLLKLTR